MMCQRKLNLELFKWGKSRKIRGVNMQQGPRFNFQNFSQGAMWKSTKCTAMALSPQHRRPVPPRRPNAQEPPRKDRAREARSSNPDPPSLPFSRTAFSLLIKNTAETLACRDLSLQPLESSPRADVDSVHFASSSASSPRKESSQGPLHRAHHRRLLLRPRQASSSISAATAAHCPRRAHARVEGERAIIPMPFSPSVASRIAFSP